MKIKCTVCNKEFYYGDYKIRQAKARESAKKVIIK